MALLKLFGPISASAFLLLVVMVPLASSSDSLEITDQWGDVRWRGYETARVDGYEEIDIRSLVSTASIQDVTIELTMEDDVSVEMGYVYSISASGINIAYEEGQFQVWRWDEGMIDVDNVQTGINGNIITCVIPRTLIKDDLVLNATTQFYIPSGSNPENYFDSAGDFESAVRAPTIVDLSREYSDDEGDVEMSYFVEELIGDDQVDIIYISAELRDELEIRLSMRDDIITDGSIGYSLIAAGLEILYEGGGSAWTIASGEKDKELGDVEVSGTDLKITIPLDMTEDSVGAVLARVVKVDEFDSYYFDMAPDDPYSYNDLLPFPPGGKEEIKIHVKGPDEVILTRSFSEFTTLQEGDIRSSVDMDDDGTVTESEVQYYFQSLGDGSLQDSHRDDLLVNGRTGELSMDLETRGLLGSTGPGEDLVITWIFNFTFNEMNREAHRIEMNTPPDPFTSGFIDALEGKGSIIHLIIELNRTWRFEPLTLEPSIISNYMDIDARVIDMEMDQEASSTFEEGEIEFDFFRRSEVKPGDTDQMEEEDLSDIWVYILILAGMFIVIIVLYIWSRNREMD